VRAISQFVVRVSELMEAEGRSAVRAARVEGRVLHGVARRLALGAALLAVGVPLCVGGVALVAMGSILALEPSVGRPLAISAVGIAVLFISLACATAYWSFTHLAPRGGTS